MHDLTGRTRIEGVIQNSRNSYGVDYLPALLKHHHLPLLIASSGPFPLDLRTFALKLLDDRRILMTDWLTPRANRAKHLVRVSIRTSYITSSKYKLTRSPFC